MTYIGIDLHTNCFTCCFLNDESRREIKSFQLNAESLNQFYAYLDSSTYVLIEATVNTFAFASLIKPYVKEVIVGNTYELKQISVTNKKTDKVDALKLARILKAQTISGEEQVRRVTIPPPEIIHLRALFKSHKLLRKQITAVKNRIHSLLKQNLRPYTVGLEERFQDPCVKKSIAVDLQLLDVYHRIINDVELLIKRHANHFDPLSIHLLQTVPGIGPILSLVILYEICDITRFPEVGNFISYSRLVKCSHESAGKKMKGGHNKIGNAHLKWAFSEAAVLFLRNNETGYRMYQKLSSHYGKAKALTLLAQKLARTVFFMLKRKVPFDARKFYGDSMRELVV